MKLKTLKAKQCRGIVNGPDLPLGSGGLLLCGSNGTGKSSFIDALEFALTGRCASLDTGDRGLSWNTHGSHVNGDGAPVVELVFNMGGSEYTWSRDTAITPPAPIKGFIDAAKNDTFILRRKAILDFIDAKPAKRYEALEGFFQLEEYGSFESRLKALMNDSQQRLKAAQDKLQREEAAFRIAASLSPTAPTDAAACVALVNSIAESVSFAKIDDLDALSGRIQEIQAALRQFQDMDMVQRLKGVSELVQNLPELKVTLEAGRHYLERASAYADAEAKLKGNFLDQVLKEGVRWIELDELDCCPLCEHPIDRKKLAARVQERLATNEGLLLVRGQRDQAAHQFGKLLTAAASEWAKVLRQWKAALGDELPMELTIQIGLLTNLSIEMKDDIEKLSFGIATLERLDIGALKASLVGRINERTKAFPDYAAYQRLLRASNVYTALSVYLQNSQVTGKAIAHFTESVNAMRKLVTHAETARKAAVQRTVEAITSQADQYFREIHPGESIGKPTLTVTRQGAASLTLKSEFFGRETDPRGYYSEGHVDSLGLCLFLALRRLHHKRNPEFALLVLDDVLHSVDGEHRRATADLIFREFSDHQIVITTHDMLWFEQLKRASREHVKGRRFEERRIGAWSLDEGPIWGDHLSDREWLASVQANTARPADRVIKAGRMLEETLQHLCHNLAIAVPYNITGRYTLDPLWSAFASRASKHKEFNALASGVIATLKAYIPARNSVGGHHNDWAQWFTPPEAKSLSEAALQLHQLTFCSACNAFIKRIPELDGVWSCKGEHLKYLEKPPAPAKG
jgi:DNA repair exonuclease SbcCD ATPase subunit